MNTEIAGYIDHTLLKPDATKEQIKQLCEEAKRFYFASVCVSPSWINECVEYLKGSHVKVCTVIGFPLGSNTSEVKAYEAQLAIKHGAMELDMVLPVGRLKSGDYKFVEADIAAVASEAKGRALLKVILETALLTDDEITQASLLSKSAGADFVKTSTGFSSGGATIHHVKLMRQTVGPNFGVKASGGIRDIRAARDMISAGANRLGTSNGVGIIAGSLNQNNGSY